MGKITFLGTGTSSGVPMIACNCNVCSSTDLKDKRLRSSVYIEEGGLKFVIDCGPDFRAQMLREGIKELDAILLTHLHKDHTGGLDDVRAINYITQKPLPIYCESNVIESLKMEYSYVFAKDKYPGIPEFEIHTISNTPFTIEANNKKLDITPIRAYHYKLPILGFRIGNLAYITDASVIEDCELKKLEGLNTLIINAVRRTKHLSHFSLPEALNVIKRLNPKKGYITHMSHQIGTHSSLLKSLPKGVEPAYDGLTIEF